LGFYESASGQVWAEYKPLVTPPAGWEGLEMGVLRVECLLSNCKQHFEA
jgi:hypothetical protein